MCLTVSFPWYCNSFGWCFPMSFEPWWFDWLSQSFWDFQVDLSKMQNWIVLDLNVLKWVLSTYYRSLIDCQKSVTFNVGLHLDTLDWLGSSFCNHEPRLLHKNDCLNLVMFCTLIHNSGTTCYNPMQFCLVYCLHDLNMMSEHNSHGLDHYMLENNRLS